MVNNTLQYYIHKNKITFKKQLNDSYYICNL